MSGRWQPALDALVQERYGALVARATLVSGSRAEALDLVHDALVATFSARAAFASVQQAEQYVCRAIVSRFVDGARRRGREQHVVARLATMTQQAVVDPDPDVLGADVVAALAELSPRERACVLLRHLDDLSVRETAQLLGLSEGAVKRYVADGIATLNARLGTTAVPSTDVAPVHLVSREEPRRDR
ncbi:sigma-70 family RNA polymerase sigma factor [Cellulomonas sp. JZ18]|uniref:RNA polymerase sigma factor n=1 Tax=Cellulomonas sp. JZ18 TaxID=2654191 RepID=UPI0012D429A7|nr:sigma-70 family RNA polymerase sigma factor [Cellulomonas sp. JZ18]QGQ20766.1 sigma-70 family RNA polymerase sigma factor [Cellulomonas sp. JZ18]